MTTRVRRLSTGLLIAALSAAVAVAVAHLDFAVRVENTSYDWRVRRTAPPAPPDSPIVIVEINESSVRTMEPLVGRWPWPRLVHGSAIDYMAAAGARVIAYDILFLEREGRGETVIDGRTVSGGQSDDALRTSIEKAGNVLLLADATFEGLVSEAASVPSSALLPGTIYTPGEGFEARRVTLPFATIAGVSAGIGHNLIRKDEGSDFARRTLPFVDADGVAVPSIGLAAALAYLRASPADVMRQDASLKVGSVELPLSASPVVSRDGTRSPSIASLLRFRRPTDHADGSRSVFETYSFFDVLLSADQLANGQTPAIPPSAFKDKLVFVGTSAAGTYDSYATPFSTNEPGVELHAALADNVLAGYTIRRASASVDFAIVVVAATVTGLLTTTLPAVWASAAVALLAAALMWWLERQVGQGVWIAAVAPMTATGVALLAGVTWQYLVEGRNKREIRRLFGRYVSNDVIEQLTTNPALASLGGQRREMTVLFSDIRGFTSASEKGEPEAIVAQLNEYFSAMVEVLFRHRGTLDKFVGDMVMGLFGAPLSDSRHADHAVAAALEMSTRLDSLNVRWRAEGKPALDIGIGINSGEMIAGNIGSEAIMSYTVIGDAVNLGARLESLNKEYGSRILISDTTMSQLTIPVRTRTVGSVVVKGRTQPVIVHEVLTTEHPV